MGKLAAGLGKRARPAATTAISRAALQALPIVRARTQEVKAVAFGNLLRGWHIEQLSWDRARITNTRPYAGNVERGRRPGAKMPPVLALVPWVRKVIRPAESQVHGVAYVIARAIAIRGIQARPIATNPLFKRQIDGILAKELEAVLDKELRQQTGLLKRAISTIRRLF